MWRQPSSAFPVERSLTISVYNARDLAPMRGRALGVNKTKTPAANAKTVIIANPYEKVPVLVCRYPNAYGPAKPAMLPTALTIPTVAAAADSLRVSVGIAQNAGRNAEIMHAVLSNTTVLDRRICPTLLASLTDAFPFSRFCSIHCRCSGASQAASPGQSVRTK